MHTVFALLCFVVVIHWLIFPYPSGLLHWHCGNLTIAPVPAKQPWWIWINTSCEFIMNDCSTYGINSLISKQSLLTCKRNVFVLNHWYPHTGWYTYKTLLAILTHWGLTKLSTFHRHFLVCVSNENGWLLNKVPMKYFLSSLIDQTTLVQVW